MYYYRSGFHIIIYDHIYVLGGMEVQAQVFEIVIESIDND